jgi:nitrous oxidase accessory protein NosD
VPSILLRAIFLRASLVRAGVPALLFVLAAGGAAAETTCRFDLTGQTLRLLDDCVTDASLEVPDGTTLDGGGHAVFAIDPQGGRFQGGVIVARGRWAAVVNLRVAAQGLEDGCETGARRLRGIYFDGAGGVISNNVVSAIFKRESACEEGHAIEVRNTERGGRIAVDIGYNTVDLYQKSGIVVTGAADAWVHHNLIGASAQQAILPANGIQLGPGAGGVIELNTIRGNSSSTETAGTAVLLARTAPGAIVRANSITGNADVGIYVLADEATIEGNELTDTGVDGAHDIGIGNYGSYNRVRDNMVRGFATRYQGVADALPAGRTVALE